MTVQYSLHEEPLISIVVPFYNSNGKILFFLENIIKQDVSDVEIIFIDDGSSDNTSAVIEHFFSDRYNIVNYKIIKKNNGGVSSARNLGLSISTGKYIMFVDSDDALMLDSLKVIKSIISNETSTTFIFEYKRISESEIYSINNFRVKLQKKYSSSKDFFNKNYLQGDLIRRISMCSCLYHRNFLMEHGLKFDESFHYGEDQQFLLLNVNLSDSISIYSTPILAYVDYSTSATGIFSHRWFDSVLMFKALGNMPLFKSQGSAINYRVNLELLGISNKYITNNNILASRNFISSKVKSQRMSSSDLKFILLFRFTIVYVLLYKIYRALK